MRYYCYKSSICCDNFAAINAQLSRLRALRCDNVGLVFHRTLRERDAETVTSAHALELGS